MPIAKQQQHEQEQAMYLLRHEPGLQALRAWIYDKRDQINNKWYNSSGDELLRWQGEARIVAALIRMLDVGPAIKGDL